MWLVFHLNILLSHYMKDMELAGKNSELKKYRMNRSAVSLSTSSLSSPLYHIILLLTSFIQVVSFPLVIYSRACIHFSY